MNNKNIILLIVLVLPVFLTGCHKQIASKPFEKSMPSESLIAFSRLTDDHWQIWIIRPDGSGSRQITKSPCDKRYPVWAEEGRALYYRTNNSEAFRVDLITGMETRLFKSLGLNGGVLPSPDGTKQLFVRIRFEPKDSSNIWLADSEGNNAKMLTKGTGMDYDPSWSPDGQRIAYVHSYSAGTSEVYTIDIDGKNIQRLTKNTVLDLSPVFSPDGKQIAYVSNITGNYEIWIMDSDGSSNIQLTQSDGLDTRPFWSPDGKEIVFVSNRSGDEQLWIMSKDGSNVRQFTEGPPSIDPAWRGK